MPVLRIWKILTPQLLKWQADANGHWKTCAYCGLKFETGSQTGKTATCTQKAVCEICGQEYGGFAAHIPTVINAKEATETAPKIGDTYNPWLWTALALTACCGTVGAASYGRKKEIQH